MGSSLIARIGAKLASPSDCTPDATQKPYSRVVRSPEQPSPSSPESRRRIHVKARHKLVICIALVAATVAGAAIQAPRAAAATPCWKLLLTDWYDGRIDHVYPIHCYTDALKHLPPDVQTYSSAHDDILRALQSAKADLKKEGKPVTPNTLVPANNGGNPKPPKGGTGTTTTSTDTVPTTTTNEPGNQSSNPVSNLNNSGPFSLPLPLLVLGGLAILLVAAGAAGLIAKRFQNRQPPPAA
jgi:hypothetical protein